MRLAVLKAFPAGDDVFVDSVPFAIGRCRTANFIIPDVTVSRNHCQIASENFQWKIKDFSSSGTYVNDKLVGKDCCEILNVGDVIKLGSSESNLAWVFCPLDRASSINEKPKLKNQSVDVAFRSRILKNSDAEKCNSGEKPQQIRNEKPTEECDKISREIQTPTSILLVLDKEKENIDENSRDESLKCQDRNSEIEADDGNLMSDIKFVPGREKENTSLTERNSNCNKGDEVNNDSSAEANKVQLLSKNGSKSEKSLLLSKDLEKMKNGLSNSKLEKSASTEELQAANPNNRSESVQLKTNILKKLTDLLEAELECTICSELFVNAVTLGCTHTFCQFCLKQWKKKQKACPICRKKIRNESRSLVLDNYIEKMVEQVSTELKERRKAITEERKESVSPPKKKSRKR